MRFDLGQDDFVDVLNAQSQRFDARRNLIEARYDLLVQTAALKRSLGSDPTLPLSQVREPEPEADR
jgi:outer membrane protein TolC